MAASAEDAVAVALQRGIPLEPRPFDAVAASLGLSADFVIGVAEKLRAEGKVRRFGAVFDARRMGYRSALCAAAVPSAGADVAAARVTPLPCVTHCYLREAEGSPQFPNLWFTISCPADVFPATADETAVLLAPYPVEILPAVRRYKVDVVFGADVQAREESVSDSGAPLGAAGRAVVRAMQGDTEIRRDYFSALAAKIDEELETDGFAPLREWGLLSTLEMWRRSGRLKRIGLLLAHRSAGWTANGMCCWRVDGGTEGKGRLLAASPHVTHCYERPLSRAFPFNLYAMVHARSMDEARGKFASLEESCSLSGGTMLVSVKEYKKTSMEFFRPSSGRHCLRET